MKVERHIVCHNTNSSNCRNSLLLAHSIFIHFLRQYHAILMSFIFLTNNVKSCADCASAAEALGEPTGLLDGLNQTTDGATEKINQPGENQSDAEELALYTTKVLA